MEQITKQKTLFGDIKKNKLAENNDKKATSTGRGNKDRGRNKKEKHTHHLYYSLETSSSRYRNQSCTQNTKRKNNEEGDHGLQTKRPYYLAKT